MEAKQCNERRTDYRVGSRHFSARKKHAVESNHGSGEPKLLVPGVLKLLSGH
jgi:hypothetical protein